MLSSLSIENIAVAKKLNIDFSDGFTVLTGKTGAGKSVIIDALSTVLGGKIKRDCVRHGENEADVCAIFTGKEASFVFDEFGECLIERSFTNESKSTAKINSKTVTQSYLREISSLLVSLHTQTESTTLYNSAKYYEILDAYGDCAEELKNYLSVYSELSEKLKEISSLEKASEEKSMMTDILKYQISEIEKAKLKDADEEEKLLKMRLKLKSTEVISKNASLVHRALAPGEKGASAAYLLERAANALRNLSDVMEDAEELADLLNEYRIEIIDIAERANELLDSDFDEPEKKLDIIESRLNQIQKLCRKYGGSIQAVIDFCNEAKRKYADLQNYDSKIEELNFEKKKLAEKALSLGKILSDKRRAAGEKLAFEVMETLRFLDMPKVRFFVEVRSAGSGIDRFTPHGTDTVDFTVVTNPGEEPNSLSKVASGGEMSRIMLALKCAEALKSGAQTVVFDEIDTGVSGATAEKIGIKLSELSKKCQVICVTHSAQVAAHADCHLLIEKKEVNGRAESFIRPLKGEERVGELARIIGGITVGETQKTAALDLLNNKQ